jgi:hypothetical protein
MAGERAILDHLVADLFDLDTRAVPVRDIAGS